MVLWCTVVGVIRIELVDRDGMLATHGTRGGERVSCKGSQANESDVELLIHLIA